MADSMLQNLLKTPRQIREEQLQKMRQEAAGRAQLGGPIRGAQTALPGIFSSVLQQQRPALATDIAQTARGLTQGLGGMLGAAGYQQAGQALAQATVTPEERQAAQAQSVLRGVDMNDPAAVRDAANRLSALGLTGASTQLLNLAQQMELQSAKVKAERARELKFTAEKEKAEQKPSIEFGDIEPYQIADRQGNRKTVFGAFDQSGQFYIQDRTGKLAPSRIQPVAKGEVAKATDFAAKSLSDITGIPNNVLQQYDPDSVKKANAARIAGPSKNETNEEYVTRINNLLNMPADKTLAAGDAPPVPFGDFLGISDAQLRDYSTGSRKAARQIYAEGAKEGETQAQFQKRILDSLLVGLSPEQKKQAEVWARSSEVAVKGQPAFNKFFSVVDDAITGTGADFFTGLGRLINTLGGNVEGISETEYVNRLMSKETLNSSQMMSGTLTDRDIDFLRDTVSRLGNTKEAIKIAFAQLEADKLLDQIIYNAYMKEPDKANFNASEVIREVQTEVLKRVSETRGVNLLGE
jgi:hypothetical protein